MSERLRKLRQERNDLLSEREVLLMELRAAEDVVTPIQLKLQRVKIKLKENGREMNEIQQAGRPVTVSDHALVRYFERVMGLDVDQARRDVVHAALGDILAAGAANGKYPAGGYTIVLEDRKVVTILDN